MRLHLDPLVLPSETRGRFQMLMVVALVIAVSLGQAVVSRFGVLETRQRADDFLKASVVEARRTIESAALSGKIDIDRLSRVGGWLRWAGISLSGTYSRQSLLCSFSDNSFSAAPPSIVSIRIESDGGWAPAQSTLRKRKQWCLV